MSETRRPLSPHLQIYRPQLTSVLSITHRGTGVLLSLGTVLLAYWLLALAAGPSAFADAQRLLGSWVGQLALIALTFALFYHLCNGMRHLAWDAGFGLGLDAAYATGKAVVGVSVVLTVVTWAAGYAMRGGA